MTYSFIKPKVKPLLTLFSKLWIYFILLIVIVMLLINFATIYRTSYMKDSITKMKDMKSSYELESLKTQGKIDMVLKKGALYEDIYTSNQVLKKSMKNLFDLVPDQITLSKVLMEKNSLILYGLTPSKDTFNFLLASPLRSIFNTSSTVFYLNKSGWYRFVSTNKIQNSDGFNE